MGSDGTRDLIIETALEMFSKKGYAAVSMRDISGAVGIRPSSLYYHFKSKQDIFDAVVQKADALTDELKGMFFKALGNSSEVTCEHFVLAGKAFVTGYLHNDKIGPLFQMLENERFHDIRSNDLWKKMLFDVPIEHEALVFKALYDGGIIKSNESERLAAEYHGIVMLGYFTGDLDRLESSLTDFYKRVFEGK